MNTLTIILTFMTGLAALVYFVTYLNRKDAPTPVEPTPTPSPTPDVEVLRATLTSHNQVPLSMHIGRTGNISTSPFFRGTLSGSALEALSDYFPESGQSFHYRITNLATNNAIEFSTPLTDTNINMDAEAVFKLVTVGQKGDASLGCNMTVYDATTREAIVMVEVFLNIIGDE